MDTNGTRRQPDDSLLDSDRAQLSALATTLDDLSSRVTTIAGRYQGSTREDLANGLYEAERSLLAAARKLEKVRRLMS